MAITYSKNYFEKYAALTLCLFFQINEEDILLSDRPDLRIPILDYGIEVTQALTPEEAVADIKKPLYASLDMTPFDHGHDNIPFVLNKINNAIERKLDKSKNYDIYAHNALYIFSHCHTVTIDELQHVIDQYIQKDLFYHMIIINCVSHIYCFSLKDHQVESFAFDKKQLNQMNIQSLIYERNCSKKRRKIIIEKT